MCGRPESWLLEGVKEHSEALDYSQRPGRKHMALLDGRRSAAEGGRRMADRLLRAADPGRAGRHRVARAGDRRG
jgi:hypothetical protein